MSTFTPQQKLTIIKHLASGKPADIVASIVGTKPADIVEVAKGHGYPDVDKLAWAAEILEKNLDQDAANGLEERPLAKGTPVTRAEKIPAAVAVPQPRPTADEVRALINQGKEHPSKRIQAQADRALDAINKLRQLMVEDEQKNHEKRKADAEKAAAKAEIERLEKQLQAAKAKLRGTTTKPKAATGVHPCGNPGCDRTFDTAQGASLHGRMKCAHRIQVAS